MTGISVCRKLNSTLSDKSAFTLIELSIVLVIIGLLVGGVLVGKDLIRSAELRHLITDRDKYDTAVVTFLGKYDCLPGDCTNAQKYFGTTDTQGHAIVNGNGNGMVLGDLIQDNINEPYMFWQHLWLAGLIPGSTYTGRVPDGTYGAAQGDNVPVGQNGNIRYSNRVQSCTGCQNAPDGLGGTPPVVYYIGNLGSSSGMDEGNKLDMQSYCGGDNKPVWSWVNYCNAPPAHVLQYGFYFRSNGFQGPLGMMNGNDLRHVDTKIDDGQPFTGNVQTLGSYYYGVYSGACTNAVATCGSSSSCLTVNTAQYDVTYINPICPILFVMNF